MGYSTASTPNSHRADSLTIGSYFVSFHIQRHYQRLRHHWMICKESKPDELVLWGHASTRSLAKIAACNALEKLLSSPRTSEGHEEQLHHHRT